MKRNKKEEKFKAFLRKQAEYEANHQAQRNLGFKPLDTPIQKGYEAVWTLREDFARSEDGKVVAMLMEEDNVKAYCKDKSFEEWSRKRKMKVDKKPSFKLIPEYEFERYYAHIKAWYKHVPSEDRVDGWGYHHRFYTLNIPTYYLEMEISKHYQTHYKVIDEILLQEQAEINAKLEWDYREEQFKYWSNGSYKSYVRLDNRADRHYNKQALKKNMNVRFAKYDDIHDDWGSWLTEWCDDFYEFRYKHRHKTKWWYD